MVDEELITLRKYVYKSDYEEIIDWGVSNNIPTPNHKTNFPTYLYRRLQFLKNRIKFLELENANLRGDL